MSHRVKKMVSSRLGRKRGQRQGIEAKRKKGFKMKKSMWTQVYLETSPQKVPQFEREAGKITPF